MDYRCVTCFAATFDKLMLRYQLTAPQKEEFNALFKMVTQDYQSMSAPELQIPLQRKLKEISGVYDFYASEKCSSNSLALSLVHYWKEAVACSNDSFGIAARLAIAGNIMDYGASDTFNLQHTIEKIMHSDLAIDAGDLLQKKIAAAKSILYLGDNAGEIVFDKLFIETLNHPNVIFVTRGGPTINDVTAKDAYIVGMDQVAKVISNGLAAPSTLLAHSSEEFLRYYHDADVIISKGQGNLEGLIDEKDPRIFFMLMAKCDVMAERLGIKKNEFVIYNESC